MRDAVTSMVNAIDRDDGGVAVILCPDYGLRDWLIDQVEGLIPDDVKSVRRTDVESALQETDALVLLIPDDEREAVLDLDGSRDRILGGDPRRTAPIVLFLLRDGDGERALALEAPSLRSWVSGSDTDPEALAEVDVEAGRQAFQEAHGEAPEAWLARWRSGALPMTAAHFRIAFDASLLDPQET